jgi:hypothetical protein
MPRYYSFSPLVPGEPLLPYRTPCGVAALRPTPTSCALALEAGRNPRAEQPEHEGGQRRDKQIRGVSLGSFGTQTVDDFLDALVLLIARAVGGALENKLLRRRQYPGFLLPSIQAHPCNPAQREHKPQPQQTSAPVHRPSLPSSISRCR